MTIDPSVTLKAETWAILFAAIHHKETFINCADYFWPAVQEAKDQVKDCLVAEQARVDARSRRRGL